MTLISALIHRTLEPSLWIVHVLRMPNSWFCQVLPNDFSFVNSFVTLTLLIDVFLFLFFNPIAGHACVMCRPPSQTFLLEFAENTTEKKKTFAQNNGFFFFL